MSAGALVMCLTLFKRENTTFSVNEYCSVTLIAIFPFVFLLRTPNPHLPVLAFSLFFPFTCFTPPQPLPLSAAGYREGEGKPSGADGALFQGAAWTGSLWQHQERRHSRTNVSKLR